MSTHIRLATAADLVAINDIYNHYVLNSTSTYQTDPELLDSRQAWFTNHGPSHPVTVAQDAGRILGWGSLSRYHQRAAYARTVENSVYVHHDHHRRGIGRALLADLIDRARSLNHHTIIAGISADQLPSIALHEQFGFTKVGLIKEAGHKFGRWLDVLYMQRML